MKKKKMKYWLTLHVIDFGFIGLETILLIEA